MRTFVFLAQVRAMAVPHLFPTDGDLMVAMNALHDVGEILVGGGVGAQSRVCHGAVQFGEEPRRGD